MFSVKPAKVCSTRKQLFDYLIALKFKCHRSCNIKVKHISMYFLNMPKALIMFNLKSCAFIISLRLLFPLLGMRM